MISKSRRIRKSSHQTIFFSVLIGILILVVIGFLIFSNLKISQRRAELTARIENLKKEIQILEERNQKLKAGIEKSQTPEYLEEVARTKLGLQKPGETTVVIKKEKSQEAEEEKEKGFWNPQNWWEWIKSKVRD